MCKLFRIYLNINCLYRYTFKYVNVRLRMIYRIKYLKFGVFCPSMTS